MSKNWDICAIRMEEAVHRGRILKTNATYVRLYKNYISFLSEPTEEPHDNCTYLDEPIFVTQNNVDRYFDEVIRECPTHSKAVLEKILDTLNWALLNLENPRASKIIVSDTMQIAMEDQQELHFSHKTESDAKNDPHQGLKELYSAEQNISFVRQIFHPNRQSSLSLHFCYCWGTNNGVRGGSIRVMTFRDLNMSDGYGPENETEESGRKKTLLLIFRKGKWHKENFKHPKQTGVQRHRDWRRCSVFATAMSVIMKMKPI
jgi:hypothetical protein